MKSALCILALTLGACGPVSEMEASKPLVPSRGTGRYTLRIEDKFTDSSAYTGNRVLYILTEVETGREWIGLSGIGIAERGSHAAGKVQHQDER